MRCLRKKGSILDVLTLIIFAFIFGIIIFSMGIAYKETGIAISDSVAVINDSVAGYDENAEIFVDNTEKYSSFWDFLFMFIVVMIWVIMFISSFTLGNSPLFLVVYVVIAIAILVTSFVLWTAGDEFFSTPLLEEFTIDFPMLTLFFQKYFFIYSIFFTVTIGMALYFKPGGAS